MSNRKIVKTPLAVVAGLLVLFPATPSWGNDRVKADAQHTIYVAPVTNYSGRTAVAEEAPDPSRPDYETVKMERYSENARGYLETALSVLPHVRIVERRDQGRLLDETDVMLGGLIRDEDVIKLGNQVGAKSAVIAEIQSIAEKTFEGKNRKFKYRNTTTRCVMTLRVVDIADGTILGAFKKDFEQDLPHGATVKIDNPRRFHDVMEKTIDEFVKDPRLRQLFTDLGTGGKVVEIDFRPIPENCDVIVDGVYRGGSPVKLKLVQGRAVTVRFEKANYVAWERTIVPEEESRPITPELERKSPSSGAKNEDSKGSGDR